MPDRGAVRRRATVLVGVAAGLALVVGLLVVLVLRGGDGTADRFVTRSGSTLRIAGAPFRFVGFNLYDAAASDIYACSPTTRLDDGELDDAMQSIASSGGTVVRFWAYQTYTDGGTDFSGVDRVLAAARSHGLRVLPTLEDGPGNCSTGERGVHLADVESGTWYTQGYREPLGTARLSYLAYARLMAHHYRDDPTIIAWSLMNEAETSLRAPDGLSVLVSFARDVSAVVHAADPNHLVTLGTQSNGAPGVSGSDFTAIYQLHGMDLTEVHDWADYGSDAEAMPGAAPDGRLPTVAQCQAMNARVACSFALAKALDKPIVVGEAGISATTARAQSTRADELGAKIGSAFRAGASGYLIWQLNTLNTDGYAVLIGSEDPLFAVVGRAAERWATTAS